MIARTAYIALGGNVGDRGANLMSALKMLDKVPGVEVRVVSQLIETEPVGGPADQPKFLNGAVEVRTTLSPQDLLAALHEIEAALGRDRDKETPWGPRTCDLDLLVMGSTCLDSDELKLPHPHMHERLFVLRPMAQIAPDLIHPVLKKTIVELLIEAETR